MRREKGFWYKHRITDEWPQEYPRCSVFQQLKEHADGYLSLPALDFQGRQFSYKELVSETEKLAAALYAYGIKKGDVVSIASPNIPQAIFMFYAVNRIGAVANMIHPLLPSDEIQQLVESTESVALFIPDVIYDKVADIKWKKTLRIIIPRVIDALPVFLKPLYALKNRKKTVLNSHCENIYWNDLMKLAENSNCVLPADNGKADDLAVILYTGGTTGKQKGAMFNNYSFTCYAIQTSEAGGVIMKGKRCLGVLPLFHGFGIALNIHAILAGGACVYLVPVYDFNKCNKLIFKKKLNYIFGVPSFFEALSRYPLMENNDLSFMHVLISGGDVLSVKLQNRINKQLKAGGAENPIRNAYGQTESLTGCCINPWFANIPESVGLPCPDTYSKIVKIGTCEELPTGSEGELCLTGPTLTLGYLKNEEETAAILKKHDDGKTWLHTGDIFRKDENGYLYFCQRIKRMIISSGYNIYLSQVEEVVTECPIVKQCCAVGIDDKIQGQNVGLYIILSEQKNKSEAKKILTEYCKEKLAGYSQPKKIIFIEEFPKTKMGKVDFKSLEDRINNR